MGGVVVVVDELRRKWHPLLTTMLSKAFQLTQVNSMVKS